MSVGLLSFLGVVIGASLQYFFTRHIEHQRHYRDQRSKAYSDFIKCIADQSNLRPTKGSKEQMEIFAKASDAKARICLYGSPEVIIAFSEFEELGAFMGTTESREAFTHLVLCMRKDSGSNKNIEAKQIKNILLGN